MTRRLTWPIVVIMSDVNAHDTKFNTLLREQIRSEFTASQQYVAIAVHFDGSDLPRLAAHFYAQAVEVRISPATARLLEAAGTEAESLTD